ncbi:hypothetical protein D9M71_473740 [compost metagenome]
MEFAVEVQFDHAEEQGDAGEYRQPDAPHAARGNRPGTGQGEHQRRDAVDDGADVEAHAGDEGFDEGAGRRVADQILVVDEQCKAQQGEHHHQRQRAQQDERQMAVHCGPHETHGSLSIAYDFRLTHGRFRRCSFWKVGRCRQPGRERWMLPSVGSMTRLKSAAALERRLHQRAKTRIGISPGGAFY